MSINTDTYRLFSLVCYENNFHDIYKRVLTNNLQYFYIYHYKETEEKKDHYHLVIYCPKATSISKIARLLDIKEHDINVKNDLGVRYTLKQTIGYLIHYKMENKKQYALENIVSNNQELVNKYYNIITDNNNTSRQFNQLLAFIEDNHITSLKELTLYCINEGCLDLLKKYQYILVNILNEERKY